LVQRLPWDFKTTFPRPTDETIQAGIISEEDAEPENVRELHDEHARELLGVLHDLDAVMDGRRRGVDPTTGKAPRTPAGQERLQKLFEIEPDRLERWCDNLMGAYEDAFGSAAADAFCKAIRAWHAGVDVAVEKGTDSETEDRSARTTATVRTSSSLPVPKPLNSSVASGVFGHDERGKPIRPTAEEVRAITEQHAERMIEMDDNQLRSAAAKYAEDFGGKAASQLERYVRRQRRHHSR
jgi:hypothetical protein